MNVLGIAVSQTLLINWVVALVTVESKRILEFGKLSVYCWLFAVKVMTLLVILKITVPVIPVKLPRAIALLNQINLPAGIDVELKLDVMAPLITQYIGFTVTTRFWVLVHPLAVNVYT